MKESDEAGEKKVTFNEATEEKNYTKGREIDEEGKIFSCCKSRIKNGTHTYLL